MRCQETPGKETQTSQAQPEGCTVKRLTLVLAVALAALWLPAAAQAEYGIEGFDVTFTGPSGETVSQAGAHPFAMTTSFTVDGEATAEGGFLLDEPTKDLLATQVAGFAGAATAPPACSLADFLTPLEGEIIYPSCSDSAAVGTVAVHASSKVASGAFYAPVYNLEPAPGEPTKFGFYVASVPVTIDARLSEAPPYPIVAGPTNTSQLVEAVGAEFTLWGVPADSRHDSLRGLCLSVVTGESRGDCPVNVVPKPFLTLPRACRGPLASRYESDSWTHPGAYLPTGIPDLSDPNWVSGEALTHDEFDNPQGMTGCGRLGFNPEIAVAATSKAATSPTGLDFSVDIEDEGLVNPSEGAVANADIEKAVVTLPEGMSANPSLAEGLNVCTEAELERETAFSEPGEGCPNASKIGSVEIETPLLEGKLLKGALYIAKPYENPFNSLLAMYIVIKNPELGISVTQAAKVTPNPVTGQLTTTTEEMPQLPFSHFRLHFREGTRSPLVTPPACGTYPVKAELTPTSGGAPITSTSDFEIISGPNNSPCPTGGLPPFHPGLIAGTINNRAGSFSPFNLRLFRSDSEQEITHFSIKLPPGITGKLAGIPYCSDAAIQAAKERTGPHGGQEELDNPSCRAASQIGRTLVGAGVGPALTYAPGKVYLAGPYHGSNLSMVAITAGKVGPFDIGTVVVREAFKIDPETAEVFVDATGSDPIPHIIRGIPVHLRDIRAYVDRPEFVLNPTDCTATSTASTVLGSGLDFVSEADDNPITVTSRFQAADCAALTFKPQLSIKLVGGTKRAAFPKFTAHLAMNGIGESGIQSSQVVLPKSEYIAQAHFVTICTRVQFKEGDGNGSACPAGSIYGHAKASTPILGEPLEGPVFLRANGGERNLPDLVVALHNAQVNFDLVGFVDSAKGGGLRTTFAAAPDAPVSSFDIELEGGSKGLFENSVNLCAKKHFAKADFTGQNGKIYDTEPVLSVKCPHKHKTKRHKRHVKRHHRRHAGR
jgi:hypothetical protein